MKSRTIKRPFLISILSAALLLAGSTSIATTSGVTEKKSVFDIKSKIFIDGKLVSSPRVVTRANQLASIIISNKSVSEDLRMEVIARDAAMPGSKDAIGMNFDVQYKNGNEKMHSKPELLLLPNQEGRIRISSESGHVYEMYVLAVRE